MPLVLLPVWDTWVHEQMQPRSMCLWAGLTINFLSLCAVRVLRLRRVTKVF